MALDFNASPPATDDVPTDADALFARLKGWCKDDLEASTEWRREAKEDFGFVSGDQWTEQDKSLLRSMLRPIITFNRIEPTIDSISGSEIGNRQEVRYIPREQGDVKTNEVLTSAAQWFRDQCDAEDEESDAFRDALVCGVGVTLTGLNYDENPMGDPKIERIDPLSMVWDASATKRNLVDARRMFEIRRNIPIEEARSLIAGDYDDADYNATWIDRDDVGEPEPNINDRRWYDKEGSKADPSGRDKTVTLVRCQWWERRPTFMLPDPTDPSGQKTLTLTPMEYADWLTKAKMAGITNVRAVRGVQRVYRQAYLGNVLLEEGPAPCKGYFSFNFITGKRNRNKNEWYGLVRGMKDAQRWANKWLSQSLHILNTSAKGGILAERGAFDSDKDAEESWAKQDVITYAKPGALSGQSAKIQPKPQSQFPSGFYQMMQFAISSIRDVSGVNVEILGMREANQPASLEYQRKQSSMTILQPLFDSLRRYRKAQGRQMLYIIQNDLSDGRLIRIVGQEQAQYVPLTKQYTGSDYDIIVDDAPTSPNQKEATWAMLTQLLPAIGKMLPPQTWLALLEFSPLPTSAQEKIKNSIVQAQQTQQPDPDVVKMQAEMQMKQQGMQMDAAAQEREFQLKEQERRQEMAFKQMEFEFEIKQKAIELELEKEKMLHSFDIEQSKMILQDDVAREKAKQQAAAKLQEIRQRTDDRAQGKQQMDALAQLMQGVLETMQAPTEIVRGSDGRISGAKRGRNVIELVRGADGRPSGTRMRR